MSKWIALTVLLLAVVAGCGQKGMDEARAESFDRWCRARARIFCGMAEQALKSGRLDEARKKADEAVELAPKFAEARMVLARIRMEQDAYVSAVTELKEACKLDEESTQAHYLLGVAFEKTGNIQEAIDAYKKAYELNEGNVDAIMAIGEVLAVNGRAGEGSKYIEAYLTGINGKPAMLELAGRLAMCSKQYELAVGHYTVLAKRNGDNPHWQEQLARALFAGGKYAQAAKAIETRIKIKNQKTPAWIHAMLGDCYASASHLDRARLAYADALSRNPSSPELMLKLAQVYLLLGDTDNASKVARRALKTAPGGLDATLVLGYSLYRAKKPLAAGRVLEPAVMLYPRNVTLLCLLGRCHAASGDIDEAKKCYREAVNVDPKCDVAKQLFDQLEQQVSSNTNG
ncbi:MAG: tetratricopeptide repeat protein [bacterium]|nr:tetratricopeptide repeat protein [bacterium]